MTENDTLSVSTEPTQGINKADVGAVIHYSLPASMEAYVRAPPIAPPIAPPAPAAADCIVLPKRVHSRNNDDVMMM